MSFPLYDQLVIASRQQTPPNFPAICRSINNLPRQHIETIYVLILHHARLRGSDLSQPPYLNKRRQKKLSVISDKVTLIYQHDDLPPDLQAILATYISLL